MTMTKRDRVLLVIIAIVALLGGMYWFVIKPARAEVDQRTTELQSIQDESGVIRDQISRLEKAEGGELAQSVEGFRLAKAVPDRAQVPAAIVQLQRLATRSNVMLSSIRTNSTTDYSGFRATEIEVAVNGRFFDVDDFMFRVHRQVTVDEQDRPRIGGRLFAVRSFELQLADKDDSDPEATGDDRVKAVVKLLVFSAPAAAANADATGTTAATGGTTAGATAAAGQTASAAGTVPTSGGTR